MHVSNYFRAAVAVRSMHVLLDMHPAGTFAHLCASRHKQSQFAKLFPLEIIYAHTLFNNLGISFITCTYFHLDDVSIEFY